MESSPTGGARTQGLRPMGWFSGLVIGRRGGIYPTRRTLRQRGFAVGRGVCQAPLGRAFTPAAPQRFKTGMFAPPQVPPSTARARKNEFSNTKKTAPPCGGAVVRYTRNTCPQGLRGGTGPVRPAVYAPGQTAVNYERLRNGVLHHIAKLVWVKLAHSTQPCQAAGLAAVGRNVRDEHGRPPAQRRDLPGRQPVGPYSCRYRHDTTAVLWPGTEPSFKIHLPPYTAPTAGPNA